MIKKFLPTLFVFLLAYTGRHFVLVQADAGSDDEARSILRDMEVVAKNIRDEIERVYTKRCYSDTLQNCGSNNYNDCSSEFPNPTGSKVSIDKCKCGLKLDTTITKATVPRALLQSDLDPDQLDVASPGDPEVIQTACYTLLAEPYMVDKYETNAEYWKTYDGQPGSIFFGAHNGLFRITPAYHQSECWDYDPRRRPWFVAASSGPKDVVLVLDISQSMAESETREKRFQKAKKAAETVIDTLTVADKIAVVLFNGNASVLTLASNDNLEQLIVASDNNKDQLKAKINSIEADGVTNFYDAFDRTFTVLSDSFNNEEYAAAGTGCNVAVIFLTDGAIAEYKEGQELEDETERVIALVQNRTEELNANFSRKTTIFAYSVGDQSDTDVMKKIACNTNGIWTHISDDEINETDNLITKMGAYYQLFASGLGAGENNQDFVAWVEPYVYKSDGKLGTTVSVPVFDRSITPHLFLGVVGVDVYLDTIEKVLKDVDATEWVKDNFVVKAPELCPKIEPTQCQLNALRSSFGGVYNATCEGCSNYDGLSHMPCPTQTESVYLWINNKLQGKDNETRVCWGDCSDMDVQEEDGEKERKERNRTVGLSVGIGIAVGVVLASIVIATLMYRRYRMKVSESEPAPEPEPEPAPAQAPAPAPALTIEELQRRLDNLDNLRSSTLSNGTAAS